MDFRIIKHSFSPQRAEVEVPFETFDHLHSLTLLPPPTRKKSDLDSLPICQKESLPTSLPTPHPTTTTTTTKDNLFIFFFFFFFSDLDPLPICQQKKIIYLFFRFGFFASLSKDSLPPSSPSKKRNICMFFCFILFCFFFRCGFFDTCQKIPPATHPPQFFFQMLWIYGFFDNLSKKNPPLTHPPQFLFSDLDLLPVWQKIHFPPPPPLPFLPKQSQKSRSFL